MPAWNSQRGLVTRVTIARPVVIFAVLAAGSCSRAEDSSSRPAAPAVTAAAWRVEDEQYRKDLETKLTSDTGWLTIAGLAFLTKPETTVGSDRSNDVVLPGATPPRLGTFVLAQDGLHAGDQPGGL